MVEKKVKTLARSKDQTRVYGRQQVLCAASKGSAPQGLFPRLHSLPFKEQVREAPWTITVSWSWTDLGFRSGALSSWLCALNPLLLF